MHKIVFDSYKTADIQILRVRTFVKPTCSVYNLEVTHPARCSHALERRKEKSNSYD